MNATVHLAACASGIMLCLVCYSILQERIMTVPFGQNDNRFTWSVFLVLCNRLMTCILALGALRIQKTSLHPQAPLTSYAAVSFSNVIATSCQYEALKHISFPMQTLGKCAKMIPVMIWGTLIARKSYATKDYLIAATVIAGCTCFLLNAKTHHNQEKQSSLKGLLLMLTYLGFDGFTSTFQDKLFKGRKMSIFNQMLYVNACSAIVSACGLVARGQLQPALSFVSQHPDALWLMLLLSLAATSGQLMIVHTIERFGALVFATIMTSRQFVSVLLSCIMFSHPLTLGQWCGTAMVFGSLYFKAFSKGAKKPRAKEKL